MILNLLYFLGWGVFKTVDIEPGSFITEYKEELISADEGLIRERQYEKQAEGSFLYFFKHRQNNYWYVFVSLQAFVLCCHYY